MTHHTDSNPEFGFPADLGAFVLKQNRAVAELPIDRAFTDDEYADRLSRLRLAMLQADVDVLLLTAPDATAWLHGFETRVYPWHSSTAFPPIYATVVHASEDPVFFVDQSLHEDLFKRTSVLSDLRLVPGTGMTSYPPAEAYLDFLIDQLHAEGWHGAKVGMEYWSGIPNPAVAHLYQQRLRDAGFSVVDATATIRGARRVKSAAELECIERAQRAVDNGIRMVQNLAHPGMTELEAHGLYIRGVVEAGGEPSAIHDTVFAGPPEAFGHAISSRRILRHDDYVHVDGAAAFARYHARANRAITFEEPPKELVRLTDICAGAYDVLTSTAEVNMPFKELTEALRHYFRSAQIGDEIGFGGGYELGLSFSPDYVGEFLWGSTVPDQEDVIQPGLVTNFESCAFLALIDTVVFEEKGARTLSSLPLELLRSPQ